MRRRALLILVLLGCASASSSAQDPATNATPMVTVPPGKYTRCATCGQGRQIELTLSAFRIDQDEVTLSQYAQCTNAKRCAPPKVTPKPNTLDEPVRGVSWNDADAYCKFIGKRLPTAAEWERAAFPSVRDNFNGPNGPRIGSYEACKALMIGGIDQKKCPSGRPLAGPGDVVLANIKTGQPSGLLRDRVEAAPGVTLYDLYGNVAEWVSDWDSFPGNPEYFFKPQTRTNPLGPASGTSKLIEGGSFKALTGAGVSEHRRARPNERFNDVGFRCAADEAK